MFILELINSDGAVLMKKYRKKWHSWLIVLILAYINFIVSCVVLGKSSISNYPALYYFIGSLAGAKIIAVIMLYWILPSEQIKLTRYTSESIEKVANHF